MRIHSPVKLSRDTVPLEIRSHQKCQSLACKISICCIPPQAKTAIFTVRVTGELKQRQIPALFNPFYSQYRININLSFHSTLVRVRHMQLPHSLTLVDGVYLCVQPGCGRPIPLTQWWSPELLAHLPLPLSHANKACRELSKVQFPSLKIPLIVKQKKLKYFFFIHKQ